MLSPVLTATGTSFVAFTGTDNLMSGGIDIMGGGGNLLCPWQILIARQSALQFLGTLTPVEQQKERVDVVGEGVDTVKQHDKKTVEEDEAARAEQLIKAKICIFSNIATLETKQSNPADPTTTAEDEEDPMAMAMVCPPAASSHPSRTVAQTDALQWLQAFPDAQLPGDVFTSVPDISEPRGV